MPTASTWDIWIDTGGTFTDCLARRPDGRLERAKVLSSSALRGSVAEALSSNRLRVAQNWNACDDLIAGLKFKLLEHSDHSNISVTSFNSSESIIETDAEIPAIRNGLSFEVQSKAPAPILAARLVTGAPFGVQMPPIRMRLATTRGTNALLERRGARMALLITAGFRDLLEIGNQQRPDLFALRVQKSPQLYEEVIEVRERLAADGTVLMELDEAELHSRALQLVQRGIRVAAVALMHSYRNPVHEQRVVRVLCAAGFEHVSCSATLAPLIRLLPRAQTTVVNAYLAPLIENYLQQVQAALDEGAEGVGRASSLHVMTSAGGLVPAPSYLPCNSLLSGPAGGIAGVAAAGRESGYGRLIGLDMGGTSTDVARFDGAFEYRFEHKVAGVNILSPALAIETVAAGGGSICEYREGTFLVGPQSAGAIPGPACYGSGGPLTLTDINLLLNRIDTAHFEIPIDVAPARSALEKVLNSVPGDVEPHHACQGWLEIANERMAQAIETISVRQGYNPNEYVLVAFGGAGGQHGCAVAEKLKMKTVLMPLDASLLSAFGLAHASIERVAQRQVLRTLDACAKDLPALIAELSDAAIKQVRSEEIGSRNEMVLRAIVQMRLLGQDSTLAIEAMHTRAPLELQRELHAAFRKRFIAMYGHEPAAEHSPEYKPVEVESIQIFASMQTSAISTSGCLDGGRPAAPTRRTRSWFDGDWRDVQVFDRAGLRDGDTFCGPCLVCDRRSTCVIETGWVVRVDTVGALIATRIGTETSKQFVPLAAELELFTNRFASIAEDMGQMLQRVALSTNVKERLDFSCGVLDANGELVVNAPHIPVHLGALGVCVRAVSERLQLQPGDVAVTNHPAFGGSHLPDVTVITPVFDGEDSLLGYVASRAHHAEIGGSRPGSMPPNATTLAEEGVVIEPCLLIERGQPRFDRIEALLRAGRFPSRAVTDNLADLRAMVAANHRGADSLRQLSGKWGHPLVRSQMSHLAQRAEILMRRALSNLPPKPHQALETLDDGSAIQVKIVSDGDRIIIDFEGSAGVHPGNLNATPAIVRSAVMYVMRLLVGENLPLNEGMMRCIDLRIPPGMLNPPFTQRPEHSPAVVGGNTETSQRIVDTLIKALGLAACSQGTMNNLLFGNARFGYYETICGGCGAGPDYNGASAVHSHMTNTRITDPEVIEHRYPVRVNRFSIRHRSGGRGARTGGDGVVREFVFLEPLSLSVLTQHRSVRPFGLQGGEAGLAGRQRLVRADGIVEELDSIDGREVGPGDRFIIETPGGGGFGQPVR